jgi:signal transduction histidine kinase
MRERPQAIGGQFTPRSAPGAGTRIQVQAAAQATS